MIFNSKILIKQFQRECNEKIISIIQLLAAGHGRQVRQEVTPDDLIENVLDANDHILEGIGNKLDEAAGVSKNEKPILPSGKTSEAVVVSSWNRQSDKTRMNKNKITSAEHVQKPQLMFRERPDNTSLPFVPRLFEKVTIFILSPRGLFTFLFSQTQGCLCQSNCVRSTQPDTKQESPCRQYCAA